MSEPKKKDRTLGFVLLAVFVVSGLLIWYFYEPSYMWNRHAYLTEDDEPYDIDIVYDYLRCTHSEEGAFLEVDSSIHANIRHLDSTMIDADYVILGYLPWMDSASTESLFQFAMRGNQVFLLTGTPPSDIMGRLHEQECVLYEPEWSPFGTDTLNRILDSIVHVNFIHPELEWTHDKAFAHQVQSHLELFEWMHLDTTYLCQQNRSLEPLATINGEINFLRADVGDGAIYVHTNPKLFGNYYMTSETGREYVDRVFAYLGKGPLIWDAKEWIEPIDQRYYQDGYAKMDGPLAYLLSQESLRWALYCLMAGVLALFLLGSKRSQRPIPVIPSKENSSIHYVETITDLYFGQSGDGRIFTYLTEQFQFFIRKRYRLTLDWKQDGSWDILGKASGVDMEHLERIRKAQQKGAYEGNVDGKGLAEYYALIDHFYTHCK